MVLLSGRKVLAVAMVLGLGLGLTACGTGKPPLFNVNHAKGIDVPASPCPDCKPYGQEGMPAPGLQAQGRYFDSRI